MDIRSEFVAAFWMARAKMRDMEGQKRYAEILGRIVGAHPHETLARSGQFQVLEGSHYFNRYFLHKFPSMEAALAFYHSPEYQEAAAIRRASCDGCELVIMEGEAIFKSSL
jgi:uncharacterized protein (DUF1330 family)